MAGRDAISGQRATGNGQRARQGVIGAAAMGTICRPLYLTTATATVTAVVHTISITASLIQLETPAALVDLPRLAHNIARMQRRLSGLGVALRPHIKTSKCAQVVAAQMAAGAHGVTVSPLKEAAQCFAEGIKDVTYAVGIAPAKLAQVLALRRQGSALKTLTDNTTSATLRRGRCLAGP